jgi:ubiquinone biosynthesis monooxygenase Coq7
MSNRHYSPLDYLIINLDQAVRNVFGRSSTTARPNPASETPETVLTSAEQRRSARLMRVNHTGEVCAQALYQGQALTARDVTVHTQLQQSAMEENDHLDWCEARLKELNSHPSVFNPLFYAGSFLIGTLNGQVGDRWNLGFLAETEHQVVVHLEDHLKRLPAQDRKSRAILEKMREDENQHATQALTAGGVKLPLPVRSLMQAASKVMTKTTYWL